MRRERLTVITDVLSALVEESSRRSDVRLTTVAARANIAYDRLQRYLDELQAGGLVTIPSDGIPRVTERGRELLRHSRAWSSVLSQYGLS